MVKQVKDTPISRRFRNMPRPVVNMNIDLAKRPFFITDDDQLVSEYSYTYEMPDGSAVLIPGVLDGTVLEEYQARNLFDQTGQHLGVFMNTKDADTYAKELSRNRGLEGSRRKSEGEKFNRARNQELLWREKAQTKEAPKKEDRQLF